MIVITGKSFIYVDVDDTLVLWNDDKTWGKNNKEAKAFRDPYHEKLDEFQEDKYIYLKPNQEIIERIKWYKQDGKTVIVWSAGGWKWAKEVVETLELTDYVDAVLSKPDMFIDDCYPSEFMGTHILVGLGGSTKV